MKPPDWLCIVNIGKVGIPIVEEGSLTSLIHAAQRFGFLHVLVFAEHSMLPPALLGGRHHLPPLWPNSATDLR
jgi:hypothetical protein